MDLAHPQVSSIALVLAVEARALGSRLRVVSGGNVRVTQPIAAMRLGRALRVHHTVEEALAA